MGDVRALMAKAGAGFSARVDAVDDEQWGELTPCAPWTVRGLLNHLTSEHLWAPHLLAGESPEQVGDRFDGDVLGADPKADWHRAIGGSVKAWKRVDPERIVTVSFGQIPAREYGEQMLLDLTVHTWDLARGIGADDRLDPVCVSRVLHYVRSRTEFIHGSALFAQSVETESDDPQDQMLAQLGRQPHR